VAGSGVQDSHSMKPGFKNDNLLITHVLHSCVKLLAVLHISSAQGWSVDLSVMNFGFGIELGATQPIVEVLAD